MDCPSKCMDLRVHAITRMYQTVQGHDLYERGRSYLGKLAQKQLLFFSIVFLRVQRMFLFEDKLVELVPL